MARRRFPWGLLTALAREPAKSRRAPGRAVCLARASEPARSSVPRGTGPWGCPGKHDYLFDCERILLGTQKIGST